jgi:hypothetical protein
MNAAPDARLRIDLQLVEYVVVVVPDATAAEVVLNSAARLERDGLVSILDAALVRHGEDESNFADPFGPLLDRVSPRRLLTERDLSLIAEAVEFGQLGVVLVVEDLWAAPLAATARGVGGYVAGGERIPMEHLQSILTNRTSTFR